MILLVHDSCIWPRTHPGCPVTHQNVSRVLGKALKIFATIVTLKTIVHCTAYLNLWTKIKIYKKNFDLSVNRPSKCLKIYTNRIIEEQNLRQKCVHFVKIERATECRIKSNILQKYSFQYTLSKYPGYIYPKTSYHVSTDYSPTFHGTFNKKIR